MEIQTFEEQIMDCKGCRDKSFSNKKISDKRIKCGEIFMSAEAIFNILCTLCESPFEEIERFFTHIKCSHQNICNIDTFNDPLGSCMCENGHENINIEEETKVSMIDKFEMELSEKANLKEDFLEDKYQEIGEVLEETDIVEEFNHYDTEKFEYNLTENLDFKEVPTEQIETKKKDFVCEICKKGFTTIRALRAHKQNIHCILFSISSRKKNDDKNKGTFKCKFCDRLFIDEVKLLEHETLYCGDSPFKCHTCEKLFKTKISLRRHEIVHTEKREYKCNQCPSNFKSKSGLYSHMLRHGEKKYSCSYCSKLFYMESEKKEHERIHTGEKPYQCTFCGKCFQTSGSLGTHVQSHTGRRPHKCQYCDKRFYTTALLKNHIVVHTGERPFTCDTCNATFPRKKALRSHEKIHSDYRGYVCKICGESFKQYAGLYCHKKSHGQPVNKSKVTS